MSRFTNSDGLIIDLRNSYGYLSSNHLDMFIRSSRVSFTASNDSNSHAAIESELCIQCQPCIHQTDCGFD